MCQRTLVAVVLKRHGPLESDDAMKVARHVREGAVGKGPSGDTTRRKSSWKVYGNNGTSLAAYFMSQESRPGKPDWESQS
jgi:hypothetical protein